MFRGNTFFAPAVVKRRRCKYSEFPIGGGRGVGSVKENTDTRLLHSRRHLSPQRQHGLLSALTSRGLNANTHDNSYSFFQAVVYLHAKTSLTATLRPKMKVSPGSLVTNMSETPFPNHGFLPRHKNKEGVSPALRRRPRRPSHPPDHRACRRHTGPAGQAKRLPRQLLTSSRQFPTTRVRHGNALWQE